MKGLIVMAISVLLLGSLICPAYAKSYNIHLNNITISFELPYDNLTSPGVDEGKMVDLFPGATLWNFYGINPEKGLGLTTYGAIQSSWVEQTDSRYYTCYKYDRDTSIKGEPENVSPPIPVKDNICDFYNRSGWTRLADVHLEVWGPMPDNFSIDDARAYSFQTDPPDARFGETETSSGTLVWRVHRYGEQANETIVDAYEILKAGSDKHYSSTKIGEPDKDVHAPRYFVCMNTDEIPMESPFWSSLQINLIGRH